MLVFPTVEPKIAIESRIPKELPKIPTLFPEAGSKMLRKIVQSCSPKLLPKVASKAVPQSYSPKLLSPSCDSANLFAKTAPQSHSAKELPKAASQNRYRCSPKRSKAITPKLRFFNFIPQNGFPKLLPKLFVKLSPKAAVLQNNYSQNYYGKITPQSDSTHNYSQSGYGPQS